MDINEIGFLIKRLRVRCGFTQYELAEKCDLSVNYIGDIENNRKKISLLVFSKISNALGLRPDHLLALHYEKNEENMTVDLESIKTAYIAWKKLNEMVTNQMDSRKVNLPEAISENIACHALKLKRNIDTVGDATDSQNQLIEIKATSNFQADLSSFSPDTKFDRLIFVRMNLDEDKAYVYDLKMNHLEFGKVKVNKTQTVAEQQEQKRRPRLSLIQYIKDKNIEPIKIVDLS